MPYTHLLVPSDGTARSGRAMQEAVRLAAALSARITVLTVQRQPRMPVRGMGEPLDAATLARLAEVARQQSERTLGEALAIAAAAAVPAEALSISGRPPHQAILATAAERGCDLIVMASHGRRGLQGVVLGSQTQRVLTQAKLPVLVVH